MQFPCKLASERGHGKGMAIRGGVGETNKSGAQGLAAAPKLMSRAGLETLVQPGGAVRVGLGFTMTCIDSFWDRPMPRGELEFDGHEHVRPQMGRHVETVEFSGTF
jgi:hypothetical protein